MPTHPAATKQTATPADGRPWNPQLEARYRKFITGAILLAVAAVAAEILWLSLRMMGAAILLTMAMLVVAARHAAAKISAMAGNRPANGSLGLTEWIRHTPDDGSMFTCPCGLVNDWKRAEIFQTTQVAIPASGLVNSKVKSITTAHPSPRLVLICTCGRGHFKPSQSGTK